MILAGPYTTNGGRMGSRQRPRWGTGPAPTHRDVTALAWVAEQYAVRADTLGLLLGRLPPEAPRTIHRWEYASGQWAQLPALSEATVRYHLRRWLRAGWVRPRRALSRTWIVPTAPASTSLARAIGPGRWSPASWSTCTRSRWSAWPSKPPTPRPNGSQSGP